MVKWFCMKKILYIEDDAFTAKMVRVKFQKSGIDVVVATDGESGLEMMRKGEFSFIFLLLDLLLPGIDGYEVLKRMKIDPELAKIPVIVFTNVRQKFEEEHVKQLGAKNLFVKVDVDLDVIVDLVKEYINKN